MPRATKPPRAATTPYDRKPSLSPVPSADSSATSTSKPKPKTKTKRTKVKPEAEDGNSPSPAPTTGGYDRPVLVKEIAKYTSPNYESLGADIGKTAVQCRDTWRKTVFKALLERRAWSASGKGWDTAMKLHLVRAVFSSAKPDWNEVARVCPGKTPTQVHDVWRKVIYPKLLRGESL